VAQKGTVSTQGVGKSVGINVGGRLPLGNGVGSIVELVELVELAELAELVELIGVNDGTGVGTADGSS